MAGWRLIFAAVFLLVYLPVIELEEQHLREIFPDYRGLREQHPSPLTLAKMAGCARGSFSWELYRRNEEYKALIGFLIALAWLIVKCRWLGLPDRLRCCDTLRFMRAGCFTPLLSQFPLETVLEKLKSLGITTVELGTGNYPGDPHCKLSMLDNEHELKGV